MKKGQKNTLSIEPMALGDSALVMNQMPTPVVAPTPVVIITVNPRNSLANRSHSWEDLFMPMYSLSTTSAIAPMARPWLMDDMQVNIYRNEHATAKVGDLIKGEVHGPSCTPVTAAT